MVLVHGETRSTEQMLEGDLKLPGVMWSLSLLSVLACCSSKPPGRFQVETSDVSIYLIYIIYVIRWEGVSIEEELRLGVNGVSRICASHW